MFASSRLLRALPCFRLSNYKLLYALRRRRRRRRSTTIAFVSGLIQAQIINQHQQQQRKQSIMLRQTCNLKRVFVRQPPR